MNGRTSAEAAAGALDVDRVDTDTGAVDLRIVAADWQGSSRSVYARVFKRPIGLMTGLLLAVALSPLILTIALGVRIKLGRPVLIRQDRVGIDGKPFKLLKFRTMLPDRRSPDPDFEYTGPERRHAHKSASDPRHTAIGRLLRKYGFDELPQLWNIVRGEMSLIGPRPEMLDVVETKYRPGDHRRHLVRPGLIGLWQVTKRGDGELMYHDIDIDFEYIDAISLKTDISIALAMVRNILTNSHMGT